MEAERDHSRSLTARMPWSNGDGGGLYILLVEDDADTADSTALSGRWVRPPSGQTGGPPLSTAAVGKVLSNYPADRGFRTNQDQWRDLPCLAGSRKTSQDDVPQRSSGVAPPQDGGAEGQAHSYRAK